MAVLPRFNVLKYMHRVVCGSALIAGLAIAPNAVQAAGAIVVTTTADVLADDGACSLREAIRAANTNTAVGGCSVGGTNDTITLRAGDYALTLADPEDGSGDGLLTGDLDVAGRITINGAGAKQTTISQTVGDRVIDVQAGATLTLNKLTVRDGNAQVFDNGGGIRNHGSLTINDGAVVNSHAIKADGGGIWSDGAVTINRSELRDNLARRAPSEGGNGGGLYSEGRANIYQSTIVNNAADDGGGIVNTGTMFVQRSTIRDNVAETNGFYAGSGGGISNGGDLRIVRSTLSGNRAEFAGEPDLPHGGGGAISNSGPLELTNSTLSGNSALYDGGAIFNTGGGAARLNNVTLVDNRADDDQDGTGDGGGIYTDTTDGTPLLTFKNTILALNTDLGEEAPDCAGTVTSRQYNIVGSTTGCTLAGDGNGNLVGVDPKLGPLATNGDVTETRILLSGSPAIDAGSPQLPGGNGSACAKSDQRGVGRPKDGNGDHKSRCDIGAFERS